MGSGLRADTLLKIPMDGVSITTSAWDIGSPENVVDGDTNTIMRSANVNPAYVQFEFAAAPAVQKLRVCLGEPGFAFDVNSWWVEAANDPSELVTHSGGYQQVVLSRNGVAGGWDEAVLGTPVTRKIWRFNIQRTVGDNYVHIRELELWGQPDLQLPPPSFDVESAVVDATSVRLHWTPLEAAGIQQYLVYRDGEVVGSTVSQTGYFSDFGLRPGQTCQYQVVAQVDGRIVSTSQPFSIQTATSSSVRTNYTILAIAFNPDDSDREGMTTFLQHRIDFLRLASLGSAVIHPYQNGIVWVHADPPSQSQVVNGQVTQVADLIVTVTAPLAELGGLSIVDLVEKGDIDGVWLVECSLDGFGENTLFGNHPVGLYTSAGEKWVPIPAKCSRPFFVDGYLGDARSYDAYTHMVEGILSSMCDSYPDTWPRDTDYQVYPLSRSDRTLYTAPLHLFERFRLADEWNGTGAYASPGHANCGSSHFPPTTPFSTVNYGYADLATWQRYVDCAADDWFGFPALTGNSRKVNGYDFGALNNYQEGDPSYAADFGAYPERHSSFAFGTASYHQWWFSHLPHNPDVTNGKLNNWWPYLFDFNRFNGSWIDYYVDGFPVIPSEFVGRNDEIGTDDPNPGQWGYWHSDNGFSPFAKYGVLSTILQTDDADHVQHGDSSLQIQIANAEIWEQWDLGRNDIFYPASRNAHWDLSSLTQINFAMKLGDNPGLIQGVNPVVRLYSNRGTRLEFVPLQNGHYINLFLDSSAKDENGWYAFSVPAGGSSQWERNVFGYIDPSLAPDSYEQARQALIGTILADVCFVEVSIRTVRAYPPNIPVENCSFYLDDLQFQLGSTVRAVDDMAVTTAGRSLKFPVATLLANDYAIGGGAVALQSVDTSSRLGATVFREGDWIVYEPVAGSSNDADEFTYTIIRDGGSPGDSATATVHVEIQPPDFGDGQTQNIVSAARQNDGCFRVQFVGIPGCSYLVQATPDLAAPNWTDLSWVAAGPNGLFEFLDADAPLFQTRYYRAIP
jgi:hypothetical protein